MLSGCGASMLRFILVLEDKISAALVGSVFADVEQDVDGLFMLSCEDILRTRLSFLSYLNI